MAAHKWLQIMVLAILASCAFSQDPAPEDPNAPIKELVSKFEKSAPSTTKVVWLVKNNLEVSEKIKATLKKLREQGVVVKTVLFGAAKPADDQPQPLPNVVANFPTYDTTVVEGNALTVSAADLAAKSCEIPKSALLQQILAKFAGSAANALKTIWLMKNTVQMGLLSPLDFMALREAGITVKTVLFGAAKDDEGAKRLPNVVANFPDYTYAGKDPKPAALAATTCKGHESPFLRSMLMKFKHTKGMKIVWIMKNTNTMKGITQDDIVGLRRAGITVKTVLFGAEDPDIKVRGLNVIERFPDYDTSSPTFDATELAGKTCQADGLYSTIVHKFLHTPYGTPKVVWLIKNGDDMSQLSREDLEDLAKQNIIVKTALFGTSQVGMPREMNVKYNSKDYDTTDANPAELAAGTCELPKYSEVAIHGGKIDTGVVSTCTQTGIEVTATPTNNDGSRFSGLMFGQGDLAGCKMEPGKQYTFAYGGGSPCDPTRTVESGKVKYLFEITVHFNKNLILHTDKIWTITCNFDNTVSMTAETLNVDASDKNLAKEKGTPGESSASASDLTLEMKQGGNVIAVNAPIDLGSDITLEAAVVPSSEFSALLVESCFAANGENPDAGNYRTLAFFENRCKAKGIPDSIMTSDGATYETQSRLAKLDLQAFIFIEDDGTKNTDIFITCSFSLYGAAQTEPTCPPPTEKKRRRRAAGDESETFSLRTKYTVKLNGDDLDSGAQNGTSSTRVAVAKDCFVNTNVVVVIVVLVVIILALMVAVTGLTLSASKGDGKKAHKAELSGRRPSAAHS